MANIATASRKKVSPKKRADIAIAILTAIMVFFGSAGLLACVAWIYFRINPAAGPETHVTTYANTIVDEKGEARYFLELEYWENQDGKGEQVYEFCFNAYSGIDCTTVIQKVAQFWNNGESASTVSTKSLKAFLKQSSDSGNVDLWSAKYYDRDGAASWSSIDKVDNSTPQYFKIGDELFSIEMNGTYKKTWQELNARKIALSVVSTGYYQLFHALITNSGDAFKEDFYNQERSEVLPYTMNDFYAEMLNALTVNNVGYGTNVCSLVDLAKYFTLKRFDGSQFVDVELNQEYAKEYFSVKVTKHADGLMRASDSNAGIFNDDPSWTLIDSDNLISDFTSYDLGTWVDNSDFTFYYSENRGGYIAALKEEVAQELISTAPDNIFVMLDELDFSQSVKIVGVVEASFKGIDIDKFIVKKAQNTLLQDYFFVYGDLNNGSGIEKTNMVFLRRDDTYLNICAVEVGNDYSMGV